MSAKPTSGTSLYARLLGYTRPYARIFALGLGTVVLFALTEPAIPALLKPLLDGTFVERDPGHLFWMPILLIVLFVVRGVATFTSQTAFAWVAAKVVYDIREQMFARMLCLPTRYFDESATGNLISKVTYDVTQVMEAATNVLTVLVRDTLAVIGLAAYVFWLDWRLSLVVFIVVPTIGWVVSIFARRLRRLNRRFQQNIGDVTHVLEESVRGHKVVKVYGGESYERKRFDGFSSLGRHLYFKIQVASAANAPIVEVLGAVIMGVVIYLGTSTDESGNILTVGGFVSFIGALAMMFSPLKRLTKVNAPLQRGLAAAESVFALIDEHCEPDDGTIRLDRSAGMIRFELVSFSYAQEKQKVLDSIDLTLGPKELVALVGPSGSGKSTLAALMLRLYNVSEGRLLLDGKPLNDIRLADLRRQFAFVSQEITLFNDTVAANIAYGMQPQPGEPEIREAAVAAHAWEFIERLPHGLQTLIGEDGLRLSGGQRQRIALARALLKDAPVLILDEATSALDTESERAVQQSLDAQRDQRTTIVIAHRLSTVERADRIVVMEQGGVVETGTHAELLDRNGLYARLYKTQFVDG